MNIQEIKTFAKEKIKNHIWELLIAAFVTNFITQFTIGSGIKYVDGEFTASYSIPVGVFLYFVTVGFALYMRKFLNDEERNLKDLFNYSSDFVRCLLSNILQSIFIALWTLLLIVPGIIKAIGYTLTPLLLASDKYKDLDPMQIIKKSQEIMNGHKMDYFVLQLSFIGWHLLAILTCGILEIWIVPYQTTASYKFLYDVLDEYEKTNK